TTCWPSKPWSRSSRARSGASSLIRRTTQAVRLSIMTTASSIRYGFPSCETDLKFFIGCSAKMEVYGSQLMTTKLITSRFCAMRFLVEAILWRTFFGKNLIQERTERTFLRYMIMFLYLQSNVKFSRILETCYHHQIVN